MFQRFALAPIGIIDEPQNKKLVFASDESAEPISFDYDPDNFTYFRCRAITADESNGNGDFFPEAEVKKAAKSFIGVGLYKDHQSDSVDKSIGKVLWAEWVPNGKYVECYCAVDKTLAPDLAHRVKMGIATSVSMGCSVQEAECSICHNLAHNVNELCAHMAPGFGQKGRKNHDGSIVYEINKGIQFNELSLVTVPADPTARIFEIYASLNSRADLNSFETARREYLALTLPGLYTYDSYQEFLQSNRARKLKSKETVYTDMDLEKRINNVKKILGTRPPTSKDYDGKLSPQEMQAFQQWLIDSNLKLGLAGENSFIRRENPLYEDLVASNQGKRPPLWSLAPADMKPENKEALQYFRKIDDAKLDPSSPHSVAGIVDNFYMAMDELQADIFRYRDMVGKVEKGSPEMQQIVESIQKRLPAIKRLEGQIQREAPGIYAKLNNAYDRYLYYRNYFDGTKPESASTEPLASVIEKDAQATTPEKDTLRFMKDVETAQAAFDNLPEVPGQESFNKFWNYTVINKDKQIPEDKPLDYEEAARIVTFERKKPVGIAETIEEGKEVEQQIEKQIGKLPGAKDKDYDKPVEERVKVEMEKEKKKKEQEARDVENLSKKDKQLADLDKSTKAPKIPKIVPVDTGTQEPSWEYVSRLVVEKNMPKAVEVALEGGFMEQLIDYTPKMDDESIRALVANAPEGSKQLIIEKIKSSKPELGEELSTSSSQNNKVVIKIHNNMEDLMGLSISYNKGASLDTSYFEAKQGTLAYRAAASDVLPLPVQEAIKQNDVRVATPEQIVSDLVAKFTSLDGFKAWAKKRKKKNKKALLRMMPKEDLAKKMVEPKSEPEVAVDVKSGTDTVNGRNNEMLKDNAIPKSAAQEEEKPATPVTETQEETKEVENETQTSIQAAFASLAKFVESKLGATAVQTVKMEAKMDGVTKDKAIAGPKGISEVTKTENPKGQVATSALKAEAMDENWTVNEKELEAAPKAEKEQQACPPTISWDLKEMGGEEVSVKNSNKAAGKVKKYYGQLGSGAEGTPEVAMDLKSSENSEVKLLREALKKEQAAKAALEEKERLQTVADKIYNIVATLREKNLIATGKEESIIDSLTQRFADAASLDNLSAVVDGLVSKETPTTNTDEAIENTVVPQVFDTAAPQGQEDPVELMSKIWNS